MRGWARHHHMKSISTVLQSKWRCMKIVDGLEERKECDSFSGVSKEALQLSGTLGGPDTANTG